MIKLSKIISVVFVSVILFLMFLSVTVANAGQKKDNKIVIDELNHFDSDLNLIKDTSDTIQRLNQKSKVKISGYKNLRKSLKEVDKKFERTLNHHDKYDKDSLDPEITRVETKYENVRNMLSEGVIRCKTQPSC